jgi:Na+-translocating ferredoxin:NAD+ oxidoreductase RnfG subunit
MHHKKIIVTMIAGAVVMSASPLWAATQDMTKQKIQTQTKDQERIYGSQLMTEQERNEYRERMRSTKTEQEREKIRAEHHERMVARAKERGVKIPDEPPVKGGGMGAGRGMGPGAGGKGYGGGTGAGAGAGKGGGSGR